SDPVKGRWLRIAQKDFRRNRVCIGARHYLALELVGALTCMCAAGFPACPLPLFWSLRRMNDARDGMNFPSGGRHEIAGADDAGRMVHVEKERARHHHWQRRVDDLVTAPGHTVVEKSAIL